MNKPWNILELRLAEAQDTGEVVPSDLNDTQTKLSPFFRRKYWEVTDDEYALLYPSMLLASWLLESGMPYIASFLPSDRIMTYLQDRRNQGLDDGLLEAPHLRESKLGSGALRAARREIGRVADVVKWQLNDTMAVDNGWLGITRLVTEEEYGPKPWLDLDRDVIIASDDVAKDLRRHDRRHLIVGLMQEYVDALRDNPCTSEQHLRATFLAATTMVHEIGHVIWHQDFTSINYEAYGGEPYMGNDATSELGRAFISFIFSGYSPTDIEKKTPTDFSSALCWEPVPKLDNENTARSLVHTEYSMSIAYIQTLLSQQTWSGPKDPNGPFEMSVAESKLVRQNVLNPIGNPADDGKIQATATVLDWTVCRETGKAVWKTGYGDRRSTYAKLDVTPEEIILVKSQLITKTTFLGGRSVDDDLDEDDEDDHDSPLPPKLPGDLPIRRVFDGFVDMDTAEHPQALQEPVVRIEVRYRPADNMNNLHNKRPPGSAPNAASTGGPPKKPRLHHHHGDTADPADSAHADLTDRFNDEHYDCRDVHALIYNKRILNVATLTLSQAHAYCIAHGVSFGRVMPGTYEAQNQVLDPTEVEDMFLVERIRQYCFHRAAKLFAGDHQAILHIMIAVAKNVQCWSPNDLDQYCLNQGFLRNRAPHEMVAIVRQDLQRKIRHFSTRHGVYSSAIDSEEIDASGWGKDVFIAFFEANQLPTWGDEQAMLTRYNRFMAEQSYGFNSRIPINEDNRGPVQRRVNGIETYAFDANPARSTVLALKCELFRRAILPAHSTIVLRFGEPAAEPLKDEVRLDHLNPADWTTIWMEVTTPEPSKPAADTNPPPPMIYRSRHEQAAIDAGLLKPDGTPLDVDPSTFSTPAVTVGSTTTTRPIPIDIARTYLLTHSLAQPTISERIRAITTRSTELQKIIQPGGGLDVLRPHKKTQWSRSGIEIMESLEQMEDAIKERKRRVELLVDPKGVWEEEKREKDVFEGLLRGVGLPTAGREARSAMVDIGISLRK